MKDIRFTEILSITYEIYSLLRAPHLLGWFLSQHTSLQWLCPSIELLQYIPKCNKLVQLVVQVRYQVNVIYSLGEGHTHMDKNNFKKPGGLKILPYNIMYITTCWQPLYASTAIVREYSICNPCIVM